MITKSKELHPFNMECLGEIWEMSRKVSVKGKTLHFLREVKEIINHDSSNLNCLNLIPKNNEWEKAKGVNGEVWKQPIGKIFFEKRVHEFEYVYVPAQQFVIIHTDHKMRYILPSGVMKESDESGYLRLDNIKKPIYLISVMTRGCGKR